VASPHRARAAPCALPRAVPSEADDGYDLPNQFQLRLIRESPAVLNCKVNWQRDKKVGVQFLQSKKI